MADTDFLIERTLDMEAIEGKISFIVFPPTADGYSVVKVKKTEGGSVTVTGHNLPQDKKLTYVFYGDMAKSKYGIQLNATDVETSKPTEKADIIKYLSSKVTKGIGKVLAGKIYDKFGKDAIRILEDEPEKLLEVEGFTQKKLDNLKVHLDDSAKARKAIRHFTTEVGMTLREATNIWNKLKDKAEKLFEDNPYNACLAARITWERADELALANGTSPSDERRIGSCVRYMIRQSQLNGHTGAELQNLSMKCLRYLSGIGQNDLRNYLMKEIKEHNLRLVRHQDNTQWLYTASMYSKEEELAEIFARLINDKVAFPKDTELDKEVALAEKMAGIELDTVQREAVKTALSKRLSIITGSAGTGKTTCERVIINLYRKLYPKNKVVLLAPTGRAARKMTEYSGEPAFTIHSYLKIWDIEDKDAESEELIEKTLLIVDEFSMVDVSLANTLFNAIGEDVQVVILGDFEQLQSVGCGAVLRDMIASPIIPHVNLSKIYRQEEDSKILENVIKVKNGDITIEDGKDFHIHRISSLSEAKEKITNLYLERIKEYGLDNVMCVVPYRKNESGAVDLNNHLQELINPLKDGMKEVNAFGVKYRIGDPIMQIAKNTPDASNGDIGTIVDIINEGGKESVIALINGNTVTYTRDNFECLSLAYAMTVHKSQGSEAKACIVFISKEHRGMLYRSIPYVALSRGKEVVDVVCDDGINEAIRNNDSGKRVTLLPRFLAIKNGEFVNL